MTERRKSILYFIVFCLLTGSYAAYDIRSGYNQEVVAVQARVSNTSFLIAEWIKGSFNASDYVLRDIVSQVKQKELRYPHPDPIQQAKITEYIKSKLNSLPSYFTGVGIANSQCIVTHAYNAPPRPSVIGFDGGNREWCKKAQENPDITQHVSTMFLSNTGMMTVTQDRLFVTITPGYYGQVGLEIELEFFSKWLDQITAGEHGIIAIADINLNLLARKPTLPDALGKKVNDDIAKTFISSEDNYSSYRRLSPLDGEHRVYAARKVDELPFIVVVGEADRDWQKTWKQQALGTVTALMILWVMAMLILRNYWVQLRQRNELYYLANTDPLTSIANRRDFMNQAKKELSRVQRYQTSLAVLVLDIDRFKVINDTHGHATGDRALIAFTKACLSNLRDVDVLGRLGGDEFAILLPNIMIDDVRIVAERILRAIATVEILNDEGHSINITSSIGVSMVDSGTSSVNEMMAMADEAVYLSKKSGRNHIEFAD